MGMAVIWKHLDKAESGGWRYRRRFPREVQRVIGKEWFRSILQAKTEADLLKDYSTVAAEFDRAVKQAGAKTRSAWDGLSPREAWEAGKREAEALVAGVIGLNHVNDDDTFDAANQIAEAPADYERRFVVAESLANVKGNAARSAPEADPRPPPHPSPPGTAHAASASSSSRRAGQERRAVSASAELLAGMHKTIMHKTTG